MEQRRRKARSLVTPSPYGDGEVLHQILLERALQIIFGAEEGIQFGVALDKFFATSCVQIIFFDVAVNEADNVVARHRLRAHEIRELRRQFQRLTAVHWLIFIAFLLLLLRLYTQCIITGFIMAATIWHGRLRLPIASLRRSNCSIEVFGKWPSEQLQQADGEDVISSIHVSIPHSVTSWARLVTVRTFGRVGEIVAVTAQHCGAVFVHV